MPSSRAGRAGSENRPVTVIDFAKIDADVEQPGAKAIYQPSDGQRIRRGVQGPILKPLVEETTSPHQHTASPAPKAHAPSVSRTRLAKLSTITAQPVIHLPSLSKSLDCETLFDLKLGKDRWFLVAQSTAKDSRLLLVQKFTRPEIKNLSFLGKSLNHKNIAAKIKAVEQDDVFVIAWEFMPMSLKQVVRSPFLTELKVASILGQVLEGLQYLYSQKLEHAGLSCSTVLIDSAGVVKIGGLEHCRHIESTESFDTKPLKRLTIELVNGSYIDGVNCSITNPTLQESGRFLNFLAGLDARCNISDLQTHELFCQKWTPESLRGLVSFANYFTLWSRECPPESV
ncbi:hypothetical protein Purlil1_12762 [Purpureocillium lilacinum]|uniref:Protein kinase domain-containing protein n=1 Tax=Purpureocillium lilacinum TaxID=33203 RepID=A0ABR0BG13_PURLI|nr:hypothetical protein Purlil1_12762 [Purpureocillium lilacinum]